MILGKYCKEREAATRVVSIEQFSPGWRAQWNIISRSSACKSIGPEHVTRKSNEKRRDLAYRTTLNELFRSLGTWRECFSVLQFSRSKSFRRAPPGTYHLPSPALRPSPMKLSRFFESCRVCTDVSHFSRAESILGRDQSERQLDTLLGPRRGTIIDFG